MMPADNAAQNGCRKTFALYFDKKRRRWHMPFAAIGFASVVSMMPGVFLFRMASGLVQLAGSPPEGFELINSTFADGSAAILIIFAMSLGLIVPKMALDRLSGRSAVPRS
jgi:uncharacterized membrane protein YjjB (DUF3815 family)